MNKSSSLSSKDTLRRQPQQKRGQQRVEKILLAAAEVFAIEDRPYQISISVKRHANFYRQRNPTLSEAKSELLSEVAHNMSQVLFLSALKSYAQRRQELYDEKMVNICKSDVRKCC